MSPTPFPPEDADALPNAITMVCEALGNLVKCARAADADPSILYAAAEQAYGWQNLARQLTGQREVMDVAVDRVLAEIGGGA